MVYYVETGGVTMPKSDNQKLKIFYILDYLQRNSHEDGLVRASDLIAMLDRQHNISCDRKTIYSDIAALQEYGVDIVVGRAVIIRLIQLVAYATIMTLNIVVCEAVGIFPAHLRHCCTVVFRLFPLAIPKEHIYIDITLICIFALAQIFPCLVVLARLIDLHLVRLR